MDLQHTLRVLHSVVAEWLRGGLQNLLSRFDSGKHFQPQAPSNKPKATQAETVLFTRENVSATGGWLLSSP